MDSVHATGALFYQHEKPICNMKVLRYVCFIKSAPFFRFFFQKSQKISNFDFFLKMSVASEGRFLNVQSSQCISDVGALFDIIINKSTPASVSHCNVFSLKRPTICQKSRKKFFLPENPFFFLTI